MKKYQQLEMYIEKFDFEDVMTVSLQDGYDDNELPRVNV